jgi:hypothetical protein
LLHGRVEPNGRPAGGVPGRHTVVMEATGDYWAVLYDLSPAEKAAAILDHGFEAGVGQLVQPAGQLREEMADGFEKDPDQVFQKGLPPRPGRQSDETRPPMEGKIRRARKSPAVIVRKSCRHRPRPTRNPWYRATAKRPRRCEIQLGPGAGSPSLTRGARKTSLVAAGWWS